MVSIFRKAMRKIIDHLPSSKRSIRDLRQQVNDLNLRVENLQSLLDGKLQNILENQRNMRIDTLTNREHESLLALSLIHI